MEAEASGRGEKREGKGTPGEGGGQCEGEGAVEDGNPPPLLGTPPRSSCCGPAMLHVDDLTHGAL